MPLEWFDYTPPLRRLPRGFVRQDAREVAPPTYTIEIDSRPVPFKFICNTRDSATPRPVLVMLPGMGLTPPTFHGVGPYVFATHDLLLIDYPSLWLPLRHPSDGISLRVLARTVWQITAALGLTHFDLAGSSLGGGLSIVATLDAPPGSHVDRLVLANPACYPQELPQFYKMMRFPLLGDALALTTDVNKLLDGLAYIGYVDPTKVPKDVRAAYARTLGTPAGRAVLMRLMRQLPANGREIAPHMARLKEITQPVLITWGMQDKLLVPTNGQRLAADLPRAKYVEFADLAHMPHEESPERVGPLWAAFLNEKLGL